MNKMEIGDNVTDIETGGEGVIFKITNSYEGTAFYGIPIALIRIQDGFRSETIARTEDELEVQP